MDMTKTWESAFLEKILAGIDMAAFDPKDTEKFYLREMRELRTRADAVINTHYEGQGYMPVDLMVDIINQIKPTSGQKVAAFDRISALMMKMVGCDVTLFDTGAGFVNSGMRFDVIIGNPPYQDTTANRNKFNQLGNKKLYKEFMRKSAELVNCDGFISLVVPAAILKTTIYGQPGKAISSMGNNKILFIDTNVNSYFPTVGISICYFVAKKTDVATITEIKNLGNYDFNAIGFIAKEFELQTIANKILRKSSNVTVERTANPVAKKGFWSTRFAYLSPSFKKENRELFWGHAEPEKLMRLVESNLFARVSWDGFVVTDKRWYNKFWSALYVHPALEVDMTDDEIMSLYGLTNEEKAVINRIDRSRVTRKELQ